MRHFDEAHRIWKEFVPKKGQAETVQGELLRAVEKLRDEASRNGNVNWDEGFEILLAYVEGRLLDPEVFNPLVLAKTSAVLSRLKNFEYPYTEDDHYDHLGDCVVEYFTHHGSQLHLQNSALKR